MDLSYTTASEQRLLLDKGEITSVELTKSTLERIDRFNPAVNAVVVLRAEGALADAARADAVPIGDRGPLHGVPALVKDATETVDMPTSYGCKALEGFESGYDAVAIERMRRAGMIIVGKTNTPEFGLRPTTENQVFGTTRNPWDHARTSGGSSGGAAAALALGMVALAQGSDGGGSCRIPASCCGVVGMKPSRGRVPWAPVSYELWAGLATNGPMARTVADTALLYAAMAGPVVGEPYGVYQSAPRAAGVVPVVGVCTTPPHGTVDHRIIEAVNDTARALEREGWHVEELDLDLTGLYDPFMTVLEGNTAAAVDALIGDRGLDVLEANMLALALRGKSKSAGDYAAAVSAMRSRSAAVMIASERFDFVLTPTLTAVPHRLDDYPRLQTHEGRWQEYLDWLAFTYPFNCTGQPAISVPGTPSQDGLPIGVQLVGRMGDDAGVLEAAAVVERIRPWNTRYAERFAAA
ncbi:MAG: amidase [Actinomycetota bacterium]